MGALAACSLSLGGVKQVAGKPVGILVDDIRRDLAQSVGRALPAIGLGDADNAVLALQFHDVAQRIRRMQPVGAAQGRVGDRNRMHSQVFDFHGTKPIVGIAPANHSPGIAPRCTSWLD